jgi:two-component system, NarL family, sensor histidine kinase LiaS
VFRRLSFAPLRRLQWKLTLSYTMVTVAALIVAEVVLFAGVVALANSDFLARTIAQAINEGVTPEARSYLDQEPPDLAGLNQWLTQIAGTVDEAVNDSATAGSLRLTDFQQEQRFLVLDNQHRLLAPAAAETTSQPFDTSSIPGLPELLVRIAAGESEFEHLYSSLPGGVLLLALPIRSEKENELLGILVMVTTLPRLNLITLQPMFILILYSVVPLTLAAGLIGTLFGFLTARGLSRRLSRLTQAADAWSQGDFTVIAHDPSGDELGHLSHRLNRMAEQLQNLLETRQELAALEERNRLARDLHDSVKQQLFATAMQVGAARALLESNPSAARQRLEEAEKLARQSQQELSGLIQELRPAALDGKGLAEALRSYVADWSRHHQIEAQVSLSGERPLPLPLEQALFRVAQEALANVARHSGAQTVAVRLAWQEQTVTLTISDNGCGFHPGEGQPAGVGLASMRERIEAVNGRLTINSLPQQGTLITATAHYTPVE